MVVMDNDAQIAQPSSRLTYLDLIRSSRLSAVLRALLAGMVASKDYRHLNGMSDSQLKSLGLSHRDLEREIFRRHLSELGD